ncbi:hypothetical protein L2E82_45903 [Cichorium intybus]|uniref:Uncharacterized protein n=1 Tax=Cichorium intybus TaxID=13427 RepID=A0ACB8ZVM5_CICIN|nr:hypothetical protein L2E82_45903 [Cichorium intybus]
MPAGKSRAHVPLYWHILCESSFVCRQLLDSENRLTQPDVLKASHEVRTNTTRPWTFNVQVGQSQLYISDSVCKTYLVEDVVGIWFIWSDWFCGSRTSFEVLELFKVSIQSLILISEVIFTCNLQLTLSQLIPKSYPLDLWVIHFLPHVLYKELNHHLTLSQMIPKSCPTGSLVDSFLDALRTQLIK